MYTTSVRGSNGGDQKTFWEGGTAPSDRVGQYTPILRSKRPPFRLPREPPYAITCWRMSEVLTRFSLAVMSVTFGRLYTIGENLGTSSHECESIDSDLPLPL